MTISREEIIKKHQLHDGELVSGALPSEVQRNVLAKVPHRLRKRVAREVAAVFRAPGLAESKKRLAILTARIGASRPSVALRRAQKGSPQPPRPSQNGGPPSTPSGIHEANGCRAIP